MKNKIIILIIFSALLTGCGTTRHATDVPSASTTVTGVEADPYGAVVSTLGNWQTLQVGGNIKLEAGSSFSSSVQVRMVRDQAIYISLRPMLGIEVGKLVITADSLYAVDKIHKRYVAEKVSILTSGIPVTVRDVQDIFLGRPFVIGKGTMNESLRSAVDVTAQGNGFVFAPAGGYKGYGYAFSFDKKGRVTSLDIVPTGSTVAAYQVKYGDVKSTAAGNIAHTVNVDAQIDKKKLAFSLDYKNIGWNDDVKIDRNIPDGYKRMSGRDLLSMFSN